PSILTTTVSQLPAGFQPRRRLDEPRTTTPVWPSCRSANLRTRRGMSRSAGSVMWGAYCPVCALWTSDAASTERAHGRPDGGLDRRHRCVGISAGADVGERADDAHEVRTRIEAETGSLLPDRANVVGHRRAVLEQVESAVGGIDRTRSDARPLPINESAEPVS